MLYTEDTQELFKTGNRENNLFDVELTLEDVKKATRNLKNNKAAGTAGMHPELIKYGRNKLLHSVYNDIFLLPSKNTTDMLISNLTILYLKFWQHVSAVKSHHQAKIEQSLGTVKVCTVWDPMSFTNIGTLKIICQLIELKNLKSLSYNI